MNQPSQELLEIQPFRSLYSMIGSSRSKAQSQPSRKSDEWRWSPGSSPGSEKSRPAPSGVGGAEGEPDDCASGMGTVAVAKPRKALIRGSIQETIQGTDDQV